MTFAEFIRFLNWERNMSGYQSIAIESLPNRYEAWALWGNKK